MTKKNRRRIRGGGLKGSLKNGLFYIKSKIKFAFGFYFNSRFAVSHYPHIS
jgi:hypothetical protein